MTSHIYAGDCPDNIQPEARDPSCPAYVALDRARRVEVTDEMVERAMEVIAEQYGACSNITARRALAAALNEGEAT